jgi:glucosyl-3-phosphoglycerate synthase
MKVNARQSAHRSTRPAAYKAFHKVLVPVVGDAAVAGTALALARRLAPRVVLVGLIRAESAESIRSAGRQARALRAQLGALADGHAVTAHTQVHVSTEPWHDLKRALRTIEPELVVLDWEAHFDALGMTPAGIMTEPPCDLAVVKGVLPEELTSVLMSLRGGPHAELAVRVGLSLRPAKLSALHLRPSGAPAESDAPFHGLERVLPQLPGVETTVVATDEPLRAILAVRPLHDAMLVGATALPLDRPTSLGPVADALLRTDGPPLIVVKRAQPLPVEPSSELAGGEAISLLVDRWFAENTYHSDEFADLEQLLAHKHEQTLTISLALPALNEEATVGKVISTVKKALMDDVPLLDEIVLIDSNSTDRTREIALDLGVPVYVHQEILPRMGARRGKGEALWKSLLVTRGDIVAWIDTDIANIDPRFVYGILGPLIVNPTIQLVKGFYRRPLRVGRKVQAGGGGRVTELMARPLLNLFYPELSGVIQPLSGEYAGRRRALEQVPFYSGYGVETGMLIDVFERYGIAGIAQVDLHERVHHNQTLSALSKMSFAILQVVVQKLEQRAGMPLLAEVNKTMKLIQDDPDGGYTLDVEEIAELARPPMLTLPEYRAALVHRTGKLQASLTNSVPDGVSGDYEEMRP